MGQKVNPHGLRVGVIKDWDSKWIAGKKDFGDQLVEDYNIRKFVKKACYDAGVAQIGIERKQNKVFITIQQSMQSRKVLLLLSATIMVLIVTNV